MGMYTEIHFASELKRDVPVEVIEILEYMIDNNRPKPNLPDHEFFKTDRWQWMFNHTSAYFDAFQPFKLRNEGGWYTLDGTTNLKNYCHEIQKFINWIEPYLEKNLEDYIGHIWYEEWSKPEFILYRTPLTYKGYQE